MRPGPAWGARAAWTLFLVALAARLAAMAAIGSAAEAEGQTPWRFGHEPASLAASLARGDGFSDPFGRDTGPSAWLPPVYPGLLALLFRLFGGVTPAAAAALYGVQSLVSAATAPLVVALGRRLALGRAADVAGWAYALHPLAIWYAVHKVWDTTFVTAGLTGFLVLFLSSGRAPRPRKAAALGLLFGLLLLVNPAPAAILPALLLHLAPERPLARALPRLSSFLLAIAAACVPWVARNLVVVGSPGLRSNLGVELYVGNNDLGDGQHRFEYHPGWTDAETERLRALGEAAYARERGAEAWEWIRENPARFLALTATRIRFFWLGELPTRDRRTFFGQTASEDPKSWIRFALHGLVGVLGVAGAVGLARRSAGARLAASVLVLFPLPYYVTHVLERYRFPVEPLLLLCATWLLASLLGPRTARASRDLARSTVPDRLQVPLGEGFGATPRRPAGGG